jgi:hypothetical protein
LWVSSWCSIFTRVLSAFINVFILPIHDHNNFLLLIIWNFDCEFEKAWCCLMCKSKSTGGSKWRGCGWTCSKDAVNLYCWPPSCEFKASL